jgi:hypothetical protein
MVDIELNAAGIASFNAFLTKYAPQYNKQAAALEMIDIITDRYLNGESMSYEVRGSHTVTGRPEIFSLSESEITVTEVEDDDAASEDDDA